jgi:ribosome-associated protein
MSRVVATLDVAHAESLREADRALLLQRMGHVISAASSSDRGQARNRALALEQLARKVAIGLYVEPPRRATRPTRASVTRRLEGKRHRATIKDARRRRDDD